MNLNLKIRDCVGVNIHPETSSAYSSRLNAVLAIAADIGFGWARVNSNTGNNTSLIQGYGIKVLNAPIKPPTTATTPYVTTAQINAIIGSGIDALELFNEPAAAEAQDATATGTDAQNATVLGVNLGRIVTLQNSLPNNSQATASALGTGNGYQGSGTTAFTATTVTPGTSPGWTTNQWAGNALCSGGVWAVILSNTASALTIGGWMSPVDNSVGSTPAANTVFTIIGTQPRNLHLANVHCYRAMRSDANFLTQRTNFLATARAMNPNVPFWVTESGYHDYQVPGQAFTYTGVQNGGHQATADSDAALQVIDNILSWFAMGAEKVFFYELLDEYGYDRFAPANGYPSGTNDHEAYFGLIRSDLSYKPQALVLKQWLSTYGNLAIGDALTLTAAPKRLTARKRIGGVWTA